MTVFLTPFGEPFYGGTYYPPEDRMGMPSFTRVMQAVLDAYRKRPEAVAETSRQLVEIYRYAKTQAQSEGELTPHALDLAYRTIAQQYDVRHGGFEGAPKFPPTMTLDFLLRYWRRTGLDYALQMVADSFRKMAHGGIYDQIGGGFHRYAVDAIWLVPHFEKMLYDNALLVRLGAHLWQETHDAEFQRVTIETVQWLEREMTSPEGGFYSSLDADSEGEEGKFYVWTPSELDQLLGSDSAVVKDYYGVTPGGNFEGQNILHVRSEPALAAARAGIKPDALQQIIADAKTTLYPVRAKRTWPGRDEKILAGWNGLMLRGLATAARAFEDDRIAGLAISNGEFLFQKMVIGGRVMRSYMNGEARIDGFLEDHAAVALGFISLYELTFEPVWIERATQIAASMIADFWDDGLHAFFDTASHAEPLITRPRDVQDNALPSGTSLTADLLLTLAELTQDASMRQRATFVLESHATPMIRYSSGFGHMLGVADMLVNGAVEVAIAGNPDDKRFRALQHEVAANYAPSLVLAGGDKSQAIPMMNGKSVTGGSATAYVCRSYACEEPASDAEKLRDQLRKAGRITAGNEP
jgi:uncharacterized protein YyaL (SSP411 family)